ncbi:MAG: hypothetical protein AMXMBFR84_26140 [Candidatus Hydrogenedentota bacterium]
MKFGKRIKTYTPSPTIARFHADNHSFYKGIMGPFGSGKTVGLCMEIMMRAMHQRVFHGERRSRWVFIRNTYDQLQRTTVKTWKDWVDPNAFPVTGDSPQFCHVRQKLADGTILDLELYFVSMERADDARKVLSFEFSGAAVNEAREIPWSIVESLSRVGRYPSKEDGGTNWRGVILDTNPPHLRHWWHRKFEVEKPEGFRLYRQPGGLIRVGKKYRDNPLAENIDHLDGGYLYYYQQISGRSRDFINVHILGQYGNLFDGVAVYADDWNEEVHVAKEPLPVYRGLPLVLGWDFGLTPACVICQFPPTGGCNVLREYWSLRSGTKQFARDVVKPALLNEFANMRFHSYGDPAGEQKAQGDIDLSCFSELARFGLTTQKAPSNNFNVRRDAVISELQKMDRGKPALQVDPSCTMLIDAMNGGYTFKRVQVIGGAGDEKFKEEPDKNDYSHISDALQYAILGARKPVQSNPTARRAIQTRRNSMNAYR